MDRRGWTAAVAALVLVVVSGCGADSSSERSSGAEAARAASGGAVAALDRWGTFVLQCGPRTGFQDLWAIQDGLRRLTRAPLGVSSMGVNRSGSVAYSGTETIGVDVHVLSPTTGRPRVVAAGDVPAVAPDGRIAYVRTDRSRRPLRDDVYVLDGKHARKVATFPLVWSLFWHRGKLAAMIGPARTRLVWDVRHPKERLLLPGRGARSIQVHSERELVAAQMPDGHGGHRLGVASRARPRFRRVAGEVYPLAWSPAGRFVLASAFSNGRLSVVDVERRVTARVGTLPCGRVVQGAWLPRGTRLPPAVTDEAKPTG